MYIGYNLIKFTLGKGKLYMKRRILAVYLSLVLAMGSAGTVFANTQSDLQAVEGKIASAETRIEQLQEEIGRYDFEIAVLYNGEIISTKPYFIVRSFSFKWYSMGANLQYYLIQTPESGISKQGMYTGAFQIVGTEWIQIGNDLVEAQVLKEFPPAYSKYLDEITTLRKELEQMKAQKAALEVQAEQERYLPPAWAQETVDRAIAKGAVPGEICIDYQTPITRAEFCRSIIMGIQGAYGELGAAYMETELPYLNYLYDASEVQFADCNDPFVTLAARAGIVSGGADGNFHPNDSITREQAAAMLVRTLKAMGFTVTTGTPVEFSDLGQASSYAVKDIQQITASKVNDVSVMSGVNQHEFAPKGTFTRAQAIVAIQRLMDYTQSEELINKQWEQAYASPLGEYAGEYEVGDFFVGLHPSSTGEYTLNVQKNRYKEDGTWDILDFANSEVLQINGNRAVASYTDDYGNRGEMIFEFGDTCWITVTVTDQQSKETLEMARTQMSMSGDVG